MIRFGSMAMRIVVVAHIDEDKDEVNGEIVRNPSAPGRLRKRNPAGYSELYRQHVLRDTKSTVPVARTRAGGGWNCTTQLDTLPDPVAEGDRACCTMMAARWQKAALKGRRIVSTIKGLGIGWIGADCPSPMGPYPYVFTVCVTSLVR